MDNTGSHADDHQIDQEDNEGAASRVTLAELRKMRGSTQSQLARKLYTSQSQISELERHGTHDGNVSALRDYLENGLDYRLELVVHDGQKKYILS